MKRTLRKSGPSGSLAGKVAKQLRAAKTGKVVDLQAVRKGQGELEALFQEIHPSTITSENILHGLYVHTINTLTIFLEVLQELPAFQKLTNLIADADEEYMPAGPPISPLTRSYFTCWALFDLHVGPKKETFTSVLIEVADILGLDESTVRTLGMLQQSRMGFYVHEGRQGALNLFRDVWTGKKFPAYMPMNRDRKPGELWFIRMFPPSPYLADAQYHVVFTTPYIIGDQKLFRFTPPDLKKWHQFIERSLPKTGIADASQAYEQFMKFGLHRNYWPEFIMQGYCGHATENILLTGIPDMAETLPHSN